MNFLETLSLCSSLFTYIVGVVFNDDNLPPWGQVLLSVLVTLSTVVVLCFLVGALILEGIRSLDQYLVDKNIDTPDNATCFRKVGLAFDFFRHETIEWVSKKILERGTEDSPNSTV